MMRAEILMVLYDNMIETLTSNLQSIYINNVCNNCNFNNDGRYIILQ